MLNEAHATQRQRDMPMRVLLARMRHDGCGVQNPEQVVQSF
jgi:hypothetical protein